MQADHGHGHCLLSPPTIFSTPRSRARESLCGDSATAGFTIFEAVMVILIIFVVVASLIPRVSTTLAHSRVNRAAYVMASDFLLAQSLAQRQHAPVTVQIRSDSLLFRITNVASGAVLRTDYFDVTSEFQLKALSATPASVQIMPNATATASMVVTVGLTTDYYHQVRITQAGQVRITK